MAATMNGNFAVPPLGLAKNVIDLCVGSLGTALGITENTPIPKCYAQLKQHFQADKLLSEYHSAYHPFLRQAPHVLTVAYTLLETDPDMPALETGVVTQLRLHSYSNNQLIFNPLLLRK